MYQYTPINELITGSEDAITKPVYRYGVSVYAEGDPDIVGPDFHIDPVDLEGLKIFREFASKMAEHYKNLNAAKIAIP